MTSLRKIIDDILYLLRAANVSQSEKLSKRQIEYHVHNNRAFLLDRAVTSKNVVPDEFFQYLKCLELEVADKADCSCSITSGCKVLKSVLEIPSYYNKSLLMLNTLEGKPIQLSSEDRGYYNNFRSSVSNTRFAYMRDNYLYVINDKFLKYVTLRGVFMNPSDLEDFIDGCSGVACFSVDDDYPFPDYMIPQLTALVLKEFGVIYQTMSDKTNDSSPDVQPNVEQNK